MVGLMNTQTHSHAHTTLGGKSVFNLQGSSLKNALWSPRSKYHISHSSTRLVVPTNNFKPTQLPPRRLFPLIPCQHLSSPHSQLQHFYARCIDSTTPQRHKEYQCQFILLTNQRFDNSYFKMESHYF